MNQPDNYFPWDDIPDSNILPTGVYGLETFDAEEMISSDRDGKVPKRMVKVRSKVREPQSHLGMFAKDEYYVLTTDEAVKALSPEGQADFRRHPIVNQPGTRRFKALLNACQIPMTNDIDKIVHELKAGRPYMGSITQYKVKEGDYAGQDDNKMGAVYKVGEREAKVEGEIGSTAPAAVASPAPAPTQGTNEPATSAPTTSAAPPPPAGESAGQMAPPCPKCEAVVPIMEYSAHVMSCGG